MAAAAANLLPVPTAEAGLLPVSVSFGKRVEFVVTLSDDQDYTVVGRLSMKLGGACGLWHERTLQAVLHGGDGRR
jgi:hypothetical protein